MESPRFAVCCKSIIGCEICTEEWYKNAEHCPKCRAADARDQLHPVTALNNFLKAFKPLFER